MLVLRMMAFLLGLLAVIGTLYSSIRTFVVPRGINDRLTRAVFLTSRRLFDLGTRRAQSYEAVDRVMAYYAPVTLLVLPAVWLILVCAGYTFMFWGLGAASWRNAFADSGSSLLTLGFAPIEGTAQAALAFTEAAIGLALVALLIAYLPTMYAAFARREAAVNMLAVRGGSPPSAGEMIRRYHRIHGLNQLHEIWAAWENWFVDIDESHTSLAALAFFRSPQPAHSWVTAAGAILDTASMVNAAVDVPHDPQADLCIRAGYLALRGIAATFLIPVNPSPRPDDSISIMRAEFDELCDELAEAGVPLKPDRDQAWRDFAGWRVNYDRVLLALAALVRAPYAQWSSDRALRSQKNDISRM